MSQLALARVSYFRNKDINEMMDTNRKPLRAFTVATILAGMFFAIVTAQPVIAQSRQDRQLMARAENISGDKFPIRANSPKGVRVYSQQQPRIELLRAIDNGFANLFAVARRNGYRARLDFSSYTVFIAKADRTKDSSGGYSPDISVPSGQYAGSGYDQGGYVFAAGMVLAFSPSAFIIAEHETNVERISEIVRFEGEHIILYHNDRALYEKTKDHSQGGGHPILK